MVNSKRLPLQTIQVFRTVSWALFVTCSPKLSLKGREWLQWPEVLQWCLLNAWILLGLGLLLFFCFVLWSSWKLRLLLDYFSPTCETFFFFPFFSAMSCLVSVPLSIINLWSKNLSKCLESKHDLFLFRHTVKTLCVKYVVLYCCNFLYIVLGFINTFSYNCAMYMNAICPIVFFTLYLLLSRSFIVSLLLPCL